MLNRRGFLGALAAGLTLDPERLLWRPGARLISVPKPVPLLYLGDIITIAGRYAVNPRTGQVAEYIDEYGKAHRFLQHFVVIDPTPGRVKLLPDWGNWGSCGPTTTDRGEAAARSGLRGSILPA